MFPKGIKKVTMTQVELLPGMVKEHDIHIFEILPGIAEETQLILHAHWESIIEHWLQHIIWINPSLISRGVVQVSSENYHNNWHMIDWEEESISFYGPFIDKVNEQLEIDKQYRPDEVITELDIKYIRLEDESY